MKFKDLKTTYEVVELSASNEKNSYCKILEMNSINKLKEKYGESEVLSVRDYNNTHSTSVIISDKKEYKGIVIVFDEKEKDLQ